MFKKKFQSKTYSHIFEVFVSELDERSRQEHPIGRHQEKSIGQLKQQLKLSS